MRFQSFLLTILELNNMANQSKLLAVVEQKSQIKIAMT